MGYIYVQGCARYSFHITALNPEGIGKEEKVFWIALGMLLCLPSWVLEHVSCKKEAGGGELVNLGDKRELIADHSPYRKVAGGTKLSSSQWYTEKIC